MCYTVNMKIITPTLEHLELIVSSQIAMAKETEDFDLDPAKITAGARAVIEDSNKGKYYLAFEGDKFLGMLLTIPEWSDWRCAQVLWIHSLYVIPQRRGKGIYKKMYSHLKEMVAASEDLAGLRLYVDKTNKSAMEVYKKLGMDDSHYALFEWLKA